jgi:hypothetical protein
MMKREFFGDSYDAVKRMWREMLADWAPLYAEPRFFDDEQLRQDFTRLTGIPMLTNDRPEAYSILNDPDTGIRLPCEHNQTEGRTHIAINTIIGQLRTPGVRCAITFDQSDYRNSGQTRKEQREAKMRCLVDERFPCFYYVSHAPFLFAARNSEALDELQRILTGAGIPEKQRLEQLQ